MNDQENETPPLRVCYFGTYRQQYGRNQILMNGLRANGVDLYECHQPLWQGSEDRVSRAAGKWLDLPFLWRIVKAYLSLIRKHYHAPPYDVMMLGYPGEFDTFLGRLLSWTRRKPLALDHIMSLYLIAIERGLHQKSPLTVKFIRAAEWVSLRLCDLIICDTEGYRDYHCKTYSLTADRFRLVPAGADDRLFFPRPEVTPPTDRFRVMYHGTFLYSHGVETIVAAAALLKDRADIEFLFCGTGPEEPHIRQLAEESGADNIVFTGWVERPEMPNANRLRSSLSGGVWHHKTVAGHDAQQDLGKFDDGESDGYR